MGVSPNSSDSQKTNTTWDKLGTAKSTMSKLAVGGAAWAVSKCNFPPVSLLLLCPLTFTRKALSLDTRGSNPPSDGDGLDGGEDDLGLADHRGDELGIVAGHVAVLPLDEVVDVAAHVGWFYLQKLAGRLRESRN